MTSCTLALALRESTWLDGLKEVDLSPLVNVKEVDRHFLYSCTGLTTIDLAPLTAIKVIPEGFLHGCVGLKVVDLSPLVNVNKVDSKSYFSNDTRLVLPPQLSVNQERTPTPIRFLTVVVPV